MAINSSRNAILSKMGVPLFKPRPSMFAAWYLLPEVRVQAVDNNPLPEGITAMSILESKLKAHFTP